MSADNIVKSPSEIADTEHTRSGLFFRPNVDIREENDELLVLADVPGVKSDSIDVNFEDGNLTIHGKVPLRQDGGQRYLRHEYSVGDFHRSFQVSEAIDASKISAHYADGVLTLRLPKSEAIKPRKIQVSA